MQHYTTHTAMDDKPLQGNAPEAPRSESPVDNPEPDTNRDGGGDGGDGTTQPRRGRGGSGKTAIQVIERMVNLLDALAQQSEPTSLKVLSQRTGLHPSTSHRILNDLVWARFVDRVEPGTYQLGMRLLELGNLVKARLNVRDAALGPMRELHRDIGQPVNLSIRQGDEIVYIERAVSERSGMQVVRAVGGRAPLHLTSVGKLFLAAQPPRQIQAYVARTGLPGHTKNSLTDAAALDRELAMVRSRGYARDEEELENGVRCIGAGIRDDSGQLIAGLSISAPADLVQEAWVEHLFRTAERISAAMGYEAEDHG